MGRLNVEAGASFSIHEALPHSWASILAQVASIENPLIFSALAERYVCRM